MKPLKITLSLLFFFALFSTTTYAAESATVVDKESSSAMVAGLDDINIVQDKQITKKLTLK